MVIITLTSVGYGDYSPKSDCGRFIAIIIAFWGILFLSLLVVALTNTLELEESEQRAFVLLRRLFTRNKLKLCGVQMIQNKYRLVREEKKPFKEQNHDKVRKFKLNYDQ